MKSSKECFSWPVKAMCSVKINQRQKTYPTESRYQNDIVVQYVDPFFYFSVFSLFSVLNESVSDAFQYHEGLLSFGEGRTRI